MDSTQKIFFLRIVATSSSNFSGSILEYFVWTPQTTLVVHWRVIVEHSYTIVIKHNDMSCGIPFAFMVTSTKNEPMITYLRWLKKSVPIKQTPKFMIDCSWTEVAAIKVVVQDLVIRYCHWHFFRALNFQVIKKKKDIKLQKICHLQAFLWNKTVPWLQTKWEIYKEKYNMHLEWVCYLRSQWMNDLEKWWNGYRMVSSASLDAASKVQ